MQIKIYGLQPDTYQKCWDVHTSLVNLISEVNGTREWAIKEKMDFAQGLNEIDNRLLSLLGNYSKKKKELMLQILPT